MDRLFYVGRLGWQRALPDVESPADVVPSRLGGSGASMYGRQWRDTLGNIETWTWKWSNLLPPQYAMVDALINGSVRGPLRLLDPRKPNRLPRQVAASGSVRASSEGFGVGIGGLQYRDLLKVPPDVDSLPMADEIRGCQEWIRPNSGDGSLYLAGPEYDGTWRAPVLPGELLELRAWVAGPAGALPELRWVEYERDDTPHSYRSTDPASIGAGLATGVWRELVTTVRCQTAEFATASLTPRLTLPPGSPSGSLWVAGLSVAPPRPGRPAPGVHGACLPGERPGGWYPGGGAPRVVVDPVSTSYASPGFYDAGLTLTETT